MWLQITVLKIKAAPEGIVHTFQRLSFSPRLTDMHAADQAVQFCWNNGTLQWTINYLITNLIHIQYLHKYWKIFHTPSANNVITFHNSSHVYMREDVVEPPSNSVCMERWIQFHWFSSKEFESFPLFYVKYFKLFQWNGGAFFSSSREIRKSPPTACFWIGTVWLLEQ